MHRRLPKTESIVIAGGGVTEIETAAEIASHYTGKDVTLFFGGSRLLSRLKNTGASKNAEQRLTALNMKTIHNVRVASATEVEDSTKTALKLSDGSSRVIDVYLNATDSQPNTSFLPAN